MLCKYLIQRLSKRHQLSAPRYAATYTAHLSHRKLISLSGEKSAQLLQGLLTNDMQILSPSTPVLYAHLLNVRGRIMYDTLVYFKDNQEYLVEVDSAACTRFMKQLSVYNIRSKTKLSVSEDPVYAVFGDAVSRGGDGGYADPRLAALGTRYIASPPSNTTLDSLDLYHRHRVRLGVSEGLRDIRCDKDFPFVHNLDYLNGVSFTKGCYIGQELTARTHHVGETRKRVVPVQITGELPSDQTLPVKLLAGTRTAGTLISVYGDLGLAVLRFQYLDKQLQVQHSDVTVVGSRPSWWPAQ